MGQALVAAGRTVPADRRVSAMQVLFLQGTRVDEPVDYIVEPLQDGKRLSSRHVRALQRGTPSLDVQISFQTGLTGPSHLAPPPDGTPPPERLPRLGDMDADMLSSIGQVGYATEEKPSIDFRLIPPARNLRGETAPVGMRYWIRASQSLPPVPHLQEAALAYLSDWWTNFASVAPHVRSPTGTRGHHIVSLNHALWIYGVPNVHRWMLVVGESPIAREGRGWSSVRIYDDAGAMIAAVTQECLMTPV